MYKIKGSKEAGFVSIALVWAAITLVYAKSFSFPLLWDDPVLLQYVQREASLRGVALFLGCLSKEIAFVAPVGFGLWIFLGKGEMSAKHTGRLVPWLAVWLLALSFALVVRLSLQIPFGHGVDGSFSPVDTLTVFAGYMKLAVLPWPLNAYYTNTSGAVGIATVAGVVLFVALHLLAAFKERRLALLCLGWFLLFLSPVLGILDLKGVYIAERFMYLPMLGPSFVFAHLASWYFGGDKKKYARATACLVLLLFAAATWVRTDVWASPVELFEDTVEKSPDSKVAHAVLGNELGKEGKLDRAIHHLEKAVSLDAGFPNAWNNLGIAYARSNMLPKAAEAFEKAVSLKADKAEYHNNLGNIYWMLGRRKAALGAYERAVRNDPDHLESLYNLGLTYVELGRPEAAVGYLKHSLRINPGFAEARNELLRAEALLRRRSSK